MKYNWKLDNKNWITRQSLEEMLEAKRVYQEKSPNGHLSDAIDDIDQLLEIIDSLYEKLLGKN